MAVIFRRTLKQGMKGPDVLAMKRALKKAGYARGVVLTRSFGYRAKTNLIRFQRSRGLRADGQYGPRTHAKLSRFFDAYGRYLMSKAPRPVTVSSKRATIVATALFGSRVRGSIHYTQSSLRMYGVRNKIRPPRIPYYEDCSSFSTWCYWVAGAPDPNGLRYSGFGYTGTLNNNGRRTYSPRPGDLVFYGSGEHNHVTVYIGKGLCVSHGSEAGPYVLRYNYRPVNQIRSYL
jgi:peptidoglycan hydrolase-like protein with peptidoglycan-binding domain